MREVFGNFCHCIIATILKACFSYVDPHIWSLLLKHFQRPSKVGIADIYDGEGYRQFSEFLSSSAHISLILNTDGVALFQSSSTSIWPVWAVVNELPASVRYHPLHHVEYCSSLLCSFIGF